MLRLSAVNANRRLALWIVLGSLVAIVLVAYARERRRDPGTVYVAVRALSARPLSARPSLQPAPAALPGAALETCEAAVCRVEIAEGARERSLPLPAVLRHEYPRGPPRA